MSKGKHHRKGKNTGRGRRGSGGAARAGTGGGTRARNPGGALWLFGLHAVAAALGNPRRQVRRLVLTRNAKSIIEDSGVPLPDQHEIAGPEDINALLPPGPLHQSAVHQGVAIEVEPLEPLALEDVATILDREAPALVVVLDQVTDPQNVGAILRSAAAFGAAALVTQDRNSPTETGSLAKAASGGLEVVPWVRVTNLARTLDELADMGFWRIGLDGDATEALSALDLGRRLALVLGSEGRGLRPGTRQHTDAIARLPITDRVESLNVSNAAAVALYEMSRRF